MKSLKLLVMLAVSGWFGGVGTVAYAVTDVTTAPPASQTFVFTAADFAGNTAMDGSTITITGGVSDPAITGWDLKDVDAGIADWTPGNSYFTTDNVYWYSATSWEGWFELGNGSGNTFYGDNYPPEGGDLYLWADPDALNSLQLLALALSALGASRLFFRGQTAVQGRN